MARKSVRLTAIVMSLTAVLFVLGAAPSLTAGVVPSSSRTVARRGAAREDFMRRVYEGQRKMVRDRKPFPNLSEDELESVEGEHKMRRAAARQVKLLLQQAKADLRRDKERGNEDALKASSFGVHSAYRSLGHDESAWHNAFNKHLNITRNTRAKLKGGEYGDEAVAFMVLRMRTYKAFPGYSKHTGGLAVDFRTLHDGVLLTSNSSQNALWKKSWFHKWLTKNAKKFKFKPLASEAWHWEYAK